ncbi:MAG: UDP-3-O-(3-hydroxymyristoyl)glucosamine N-acyltransferase [Candidatus Sumerlaeaceae bacterium]|nr:UDP-3-O-(3-hydroxymyristoyl)glucosamine N-acyltransferase [Candidatus Sumerlaeaceae bacterium]
MRITEFAAAMGTQVANLGDDFEIKGITTLDAAGPGDVSFISSDKYLSQAASSAASALIVPAKASVASHPSIPLAEPWAGVLFLLNHLYPENRFVYFRGIDPSAAVDPSAQLAPDVAVGPGAVIGPRVVIGGGSVVGPNCVIGPDCKVGSNCALNAGAILCAETEIGNHVILHAGAVIGADGFKYEKVGGRLAKIPQVGRVILEDHVEIGANSCIDRASFTETRIGAGTKIDNLVQIGHNVTMGRSCIVVSQAGIAGSCKIGDGVIFAAQAGVADNIRIGNGVTIAARAGVKDHLPDGVVVIGQPARPFREGSKIIMAEARLPDMIQEVTRLKKRVEELEKKLAPGG